MCSKRIDSLFNSVFLLLAIGQVVYGIFYVPSKGRLCNYRHYTNGFPYIHMFILGPAVQYGGWDIKSELHPILFWGERGSLGPFWKEIKDAVES